MAANYLKRELRWPTLVVAATVWAAIESPLRAVLHYDLAGWLLLADFAVTLIFLVDIPISFRTPIETAAGKITEPEAIARAYRRSWLPVDLLVLVPAILPLLAPESRRLLLPILLLRMLKLGRLTTSAVRLHTGAMLNPGIVRLFNSLFWITLTAHWIACGWLVMRGPVPPDRRAWEFVRALYWCVTTLATVGYGDIVPQTMGQTIYAMVVMMIGVAVYGYVIGQVAGILSNLDAAKARYRERMQKVHSFMGYHHLPPELQQRIHAFYEYLWESRFGFEEGSVLDEMPPTIRSEVALFLNRPILEKVPLFQGASEELLRSLALALKPGVVTPGDYIFHQGDVGHEMYFISRGKVEILKDQRILATLGEGDFFGEIALLGDNRRTASVRSLGFCDVYSLDQRTFDGILADYPEFAAQVHAMAKERKTH